MYTCPVIRHKATCTVPSMLTCNLFCPYINYVWKVKLLTNSYIIITFTYYIHTHACMHIFFCTMHICIHLYNGMYIFVFAM